MPRRITGTGRKWNIEFATSDELDAAMDPTCCKNALLLVECVGNRGEPSGHKAPYRVVIRGCGDEDAQRLLAVSRRAVSARMINKALFAGDDETATAAAAMLVIMGEGVSEEDARRQVAGQVDVTPGRLLVAAGKRVLAGP